MKRLSALLVLSIVVVQLFTIPVIANSFLGPVVTTLPATEVSPVSATLNAAVALNITGTGISGNIVYVNDTDRLYGPVGPVGPVCQGYFKYGTVPGVYIEQTPYITLNFQSSGFHSPLIGLRPCTTYYVKAFLSCPEPAAYYDRGPADNLISLLPGDYSYENMRGLGIGLSPQGMTGVLNIRVEGPVYGNEISFTTPGCQVGSGTHGAGGLGLTAPAIRPFLMSNIAVKTAAISSSRVAPGQEVAVTANMVNQGGSNGEAKVTLYVNGQEVESRGITLTSGENAQVHFSVSRNEPGTYSVYVGGISAGAFVVDPFNNNEMLIYASIALTTLGIGGVLYIVTRRRTA